MKSEPGFVREPDSNHCVCLANVKRCCTDVQLVPGQHVPELRKVQLLSALSSRKLRAMLTMLVVRFVMCAFPFAGRPVPCRECHARSAMHTCCHVRVPGPSLLFANTREGEQHAGASKMNGR